jgi:hypothetical protein
MQVANTLAYYDMAIITAVKRFIVLAPVWKDFTTDSTTSRSVIQSIWPTGVLLIGQGC